MWSQASGEEVEQKRYVCFQRETCTVDTIHSRTLVRSLGATLLWWCFASWSYCQVWKEESQVWTEEAASYSLERR